MERRFKTPKALRTACEEYFALCDEKEVLYGEGGLALHLGVKLSTLRDWYDGKSCPDLQEEAQRAYLRIQAQLESDPVYMGKGLTKAMFLLKQARLGGYREKTDARRETTVVVQLGDGTDVTDLL